MNIGYQVRFFGIAVNIARQVDKMCLIVYVLCLKAIRKQASFAILLTIEKFDITIDHIGEHFGKGKICIESDH